MYKTLFIAMGVLATGAFLLAGTASATLVNYSFDTDPGAIEVGNRSGGQDFGYSNTNYAGGSAGEIGGKFDRHSFQSTAYYALDIGSVNLEEAFELNWSTANGAKYGYNDNGDGFGDQGMLLGFFNRGGQVGGWPVYPLLGFAVSEASVYAYANFSGATVNETYVGDFNATGSLRMKYDPSAGSYGQFSISLDGTTSTYSLSQSDRQSGVSFDSFGMLTLPVRTNNVRSPMNFYLDDISVTSDIPEPSAMMLVFFGAAGLLAYAWRRRK